MVLIMVFIEVSVNA